MSIRDEINFRVAEGRLFPLVPYVTKEAQTRMVLMSAEIDTMVNGAWESSIAGNRCAIVRANLENFVSGEPIKVCWEPFEADDKHQMGRLDPVRDGVWDYRHVDPKPGLRIFCRFAEKDVLIALTCSPRSIPVSWLPRLPLGIWNSREWKLAIRECKAEWNKLFPTYPPLIGESVDDYLTNAVL